MSSRRSNSQPPPAVVVGLDCITGLQTARILWRHGVPVTGIATNVSHYCARTNVCDVILRAPTGGEELVELLVARGPALPDKAVLFPCTDMSVLTISRHRQQLEPYYHIALPSADVVEMLMDKVRFYTYANETGLPIPGTRLLCNRAAAEAAAEQLSFPCILKPPLKTARWEKHTKAKVYKVDSGQELLALYDRCSSWADVLMVQEWVEGGEANLFSCNAYFDAAGEPLVTFVARKLRQWPPQTGTSCLGEECRNDVVLEESVRLFRSVGYHGLGYVEMKRDDRTGKHYIIEPNIGRPTGRSAIAEAGGVELVYTKYCDKVGLPLPTNRQQTYGHAKWIYLRRDMQSAFHYWRRGELTLTEWARSWRGLRADAVWSWRDQKPFWYNLGKPLTDAAKKPE